MDEQSFTDEIEILEYNRNNNGDYWASVEFIGDPLRYVFYYSYVSKGVELPRIFRESESIDISKTEIPKHFANYYQIQEQRGLRTIIYNYDLDDYGQEQQWSKMKIDFFRIFYRL